MRTHYRNLTNIHNFDTVIVEPSREWRQGRRFGITCIIYPAPDFSSPAPSRRVPQNPTLVLNLEILLANVKCYQHNIHNPAIVDNLVNMSSPTQEDAGGTGDVKMEDAPATAGDVPEAAAELPSPAASITKQEVEVINGILKRFSEYRNELYVFPALFSSK